MMRKGKRAKGREREREKKIGNFYNDAGFNCHLAAAWMLLIFYFIIGADRKTSDSGD